MGYRPDLVASNPKGQGIFTVPTGTAAPIKTERFFCKAVVLIANSANTVAIMIGDENVTVNDPGFVKTAAIVIEGATIKSVDLNKVYAISGTAGQKLDWIAVG